MDKVPFRFYTVALVATALCLGLLAWQSYESSQLFEVAISRESRLKELAGIITHLNEVLTMSARMAAATGDREWERRYTRHEPELEGAIQEAVRLAPEIYAGEAIPHLSEANRQLVTMERQAFALVHQGYLWEARAILFSDEYEVQKLLYSEETERLTARLRERANAALAAERRKAFLAGVVAILVFPLLLSAWLLVLRTLRRWRRALEATNQTLRQQAAELQQLTRTLDQRVAERTEALTNQIVERHEAEAELRRAQAQLIQSEKLAALGRFSAGLAHEVKNPLGVVLGGLEYLETRVPPGDHEWSEAIQKMKEAVVRADAVVLGLLQFARPSQRTLERTDPQTLVTDTLAFLRYRAPLSNIQIVTEFASNGLAVSVDRNQMQQVLFNILTNAVEAMPQGGMIGVRTYAEPPAAPGGPGRCVVEVADTGAGMAPAALANLFEPFFTTKRDQKGTGLGLSIAKMIVEHHGGDILMESQPGKGTTVRIVLPQA